MMHIRKLRARSGIGFSMGRGIVFIALAPMIAWGQSTTDSARTTQVARERSVVQLTPARPSQGSIVRITIRPERGPLPRADSGAAPRQRADTVAGAAAWTIARPDSARPDSLARPRADTVGSRAADSLAQPRVDTAATAANAVDSARGRIVAIRGTLFGEPLHFTPGDSGTYTAIGGIPVDAPKSVRLSVVIERSGVTSDTVPLQLQIARTAYKMEKLTVAPKFGQAPDSALAARIAREQALASDVSRKSHETPQLWEGAFTRPRVARVTSGFGDGREFNGTVQSRHMGLDLAGAVGAPVIAPARGVVALIGEFYLAGNCVYVDHGGGLVTAYFHLSAVNVAEGDTIAAGDTIGKVGATGRVTGPHLHWVARYGAITVDPSTLLELGPARREPSP